MENENSKIASSLFENVPRMGYSDNLLHLFASSSSLDMTTTDDNDDNIKNYFMGLTFISLVVLIMTIIWLLVLSILLCCGRNSNGFLSGKRFQPKSKNALPIRIVFSVCAILWIMTTSLNVAKGIDNLQGTLEIIETNNANVSRLGIDGAIIVKNLTQIGLNAADVRNVLVTNLTAAHFCPASVGSKDILQGLLDDNDNNNNIDLLSQKDAVVQRLTDLSNFLTDNLRTLEDGLRDVEIGTEQIKTLLDTIHFHVDDYLSLSIIIFWILVPSFLLMGVIVASFLFPFDSKTTTAAMPNCRFLWECCLNWLFLPILILQTILSAITASLLSVLAVANSDFCSPSMSTSISSSVSDTTRSIIKNTTTTTSTLDGPQLKLLSIAESFGLDETNLMTLRYYLSNCSEDNPFAVFVEYVEEYLPTAARSIINLTSSIDSIGINRLEAVCNHTNGGNSNSFRALYDLLGRMNTMLATIAGVVNRVLQLVKCENISPIITAMTNDALCQRTTNALGWSVVCFSLIAFLGLIMITFRSSFRQSTMEVTLLVDDDDNDTDNHSNDDEENHDNNHYENANALTVRNLNYEDYCDDEDDDKKFVVGKTYYPPPNTYKTFVTLRKNDDDSDNTDNKRTKRKEKKKS